MRILMAHNRYLGGRGGEDESTDSEVALLRRMGHEVEFYEEDNRRILTLGRLQAATRSVWSRETYREVRKRLATGRHNLLHVQNFFSLISPSIYYAARKEGVPVVQSLRNYRLLCSNGLLFREGRPCEKCVGRFAPWAGIRHACYRGSRSGSAVVAAMVGVHRGLNTWSSQVDQYITLSEFARRKLIQGGIAAERIVVKPNFVDPDPQPGAAERKGALFVGRISPEKGIATLLSAWKQLGSSELLQIIGEGPLQQDLAHPAHDAGVRYLGRLAPQQAYGHMGSARFLVFPSEWYETFGRVAVEAFAKGTPVIAANHGAIAEIVEHGRTGLHFIPGDARDLAERMRWAFDHPQEMAEMGRNARREYEQKYTAEANYELLMAIYGRVLGGVAAPSTAAAATQGGRHGHA